MPRYAEKLGIRRTSQSNDRQVLPTPMMAHIKANASATVAGDRCVRRYAHGRMSILTPRALPSSFWTRRLQSYIEIRPGPAFSVSHGPALSAHTMDARDNRPSDICLYEFCVAELYHRERNHQGKENVLLFPAATQAKNGVDGSVGCKERLGGQLKYYHREAA